METIGRVLAAITAMAMLGCASVPEQSPESAGIFSDEAFQQFRLQVNPEAVFALTPAMQRYLETTLAPAVRAKGREGLIDALYSSQLLGLSYDSRMTRNAGEAFEARAGNCLSLVIMTSAFAKALGIEVRYQRLRAEDIWFRDGDLTQLIGHVNLSLGQGANPAMRASNAPGWLTVDFLPLDDAQRTRVRTIEEQRVVAMYFNNRAAETLVEGRVEQAYWWAKASIEQDRSFASGYITLAVIYFRRGQDLMTERTLQLALTVEPDNPQALYNLAAVLRRSGRLAEAQTVEKRLSLVQPQTPIGLYKTGLAAYQHGDYENARVSFAKALRSAPEEQDFHFMLGMAYWRLGQRESALEELERARRLARDERQSRVYSAKLSQLMGASSMTAPTTP